MIRRSNASDVPMIVALGVEALSRGGYPGLILDKEKLNDVAMRCVLSPSNLSMVAERDGVIGGAFCAVVQECLFFKGRQASVVQFYCKFPGEGIAMIREFVRWADRPEIVLKLFALETNADPRIGKLLDRLGLKNSRELRTNL